MSNNFYELNLDGLVGPTHHYAGLAFGNTASMAHQNQVSNPREAALQGLEKIRLLHKLGLKQAILPPQKRPNLQLLHALGFTGTISQQLNQARQDKRALSAAFSASSMWAANAGTVSPAPDTKDKRTHFTAANLVRHIHRHQEADTTHALFKRIFSNTSHFVHHDILPKTPEYNDEGAANHNRLVSDYGSQGLHVFVYGSHQHTTRFPARQSYLASKAIARQHKLDPKKTFFFEQNPTAIDKGVFHNDVIALANKHVFLVHEKAFVNQTDCLKQLKKQADFDINIIQIPEQALSLEEAVTSYLFNSQLITLPNTTDMALISPKECKHMPAAKKVIDELIADAKNPIQSVHYVSLKQSMQNGGGPACLRLRMVLNADALETMHQGILVTTPLLDKLEALIKQYYQTTLALDDLSSPMLVDEAFSAYDAILNLLSLG